MGVIYKVTNLLSGKVYIGKRELTVERFWNRQYYGSGKYITRALRKHGLANFTRQVIEECDNSILGEREKYWIQHYNSLQPNGYNIGHGGEGDSGGPNKGRHWSNETREKIRRTLKAKYASGELVNPFQGKQHSAASRAIICSKRSTQVTSTEACRAARKIIAEQRGYYLSPEARKRIGEKNSVNMQAYHRKMKGGD